MNWVFILIFSLQSDTVILTARHLWTKLKSLDGTFRYKSISELNDMCYI